MAIPAVSELASSGILPVGGDCCFYRILLQLARDGLRNIAENQSISASTCILASFLVCSAVSVLTTWDVPDTAAVGTAVSLYKFRNRIPQSVHPSDTPVAQS